MSRRGGTSARRERLSRFVWEASPLPAARKLELFKWADFMAASLKGEAAEPPAEWTPEQRALWQRILADPQERAAVVAWMVQGAAELEADFRAYEHGSA